MSARHSVDEYSIRFVTPAFLGNAEQSAQWRTPPFKGLFRHWYRIVLAKRGGYDWTRIRETEGKVLGSVHGGPGARASRVRLALDVWAQGQLTTWPRDRKLKHPEVRQQVGATLYLGYGPLQYQRGSTQLAMNPAIEADESVRLTLTYPAEEAADIRAALCLMHCFGTVGGRSRNGWGSFTLTRADGHPLDCPIHQNEGSPSAQATPCSVLHDAARAKLRETWGRPWRDCLELCWPHALGVDDTGLLLWQIDTYSSWQDAMNALAEVKIRFRTQFPFTQKGPHPNAEDRHILAYPVTKHPVKHWRNNKRWANQLRFKVALDDRGRYCALAFHIPCGLPREMASKGRVNDAQQIAVWQRVHACLDEQAKRLP